MNQDAAREIRTKRPPRILLAGGGTGGHVYPAIAIADALRNEAPEAVLAFAGTRDKIEWQAVPKAGYPIHPITIQGFHRANLWRNALFPLKLLAGLGQSWNLIGAFDPDIVIGTGGYVSGPVLYAAHRRGRPVVIQEQNAFPGITNRILSRYASTIFIAFDDASSHFNETKCVLAGNPIRQSLCEADRREAAAHFDFSGEARVLLVFGGSLGSAALNSIMEELIEPILSSSDLHVIWQTGSIYYKDLAGRVTDHPRLRLLEYIDRMDLAYSMADLVVARAGAITCSELAATGTPSILIPSPNVAEDHQTKNAESLQRAGAAILVPEREMGDALYDTLLATLSDRERLAGMSEAAARLARPDAAQHIAKSTLQLLNA